MDSKTFKMIIIGDSAVGKTTLVKSFTNGKFSSSENLTVGVEFDSKETVINNERV